MFDLGFWEVLIIALIGLLVLGPERMAKAVRMVGYWVGWARSSFNSARTEIERELQVEDMRRVGDSLRRDVESTRRDLENYRMEVESSTRRSILEAQRSARLSSAERAEQGDDGQIGNDAGDGRTSGQTSSEAAAASEPQQTDNRDQQAHDQIQEQNR